MSEISNKALFLDRDGVININHGYVYTAEQFDLVDGIIEVVRQANSLGYKVIVVTNQSGIGRGYYGEDDFLALCDWMKSLFANKHAHIDHIYYCPHHPENAKSPYKIDCECRKPKEGMARQAIEDFSLDPHQSIMIGDKLSDVEFACRAKIARIYWLEANPNAEKLAQFAHIKCRNSNDIIRVSSLEEITL